MGSHSHSSHTDMNTDVPPPSSSSSSNVVLQLTKKQMLKQKKQNKKMAKQVAKARKVAYRELEARQNRKTALKIAEAHLITEKLVQSEGRKRKIKDAEDGKPAVYKWRRKRAK